MRYLDTSNITEKQIDTIQIIQNEGDTPSRARRIVEENDILISTVHPNLRHYVFIKKMGDALIASTGYAVLTAKKTISC